jgi:soluble cytochrome b562
MKYLSFLIFIFSLVSFNSYAKQSDLSVTMKNIGHLYKKTLKAGDNEQKVQHISEMIKLLEKSKKAKFKSGTQEESVQGLNKVISLLTLAQKQILAGKIDESESTLLKIDGLRKQYHKLHEPPSFWELIFG